MSKILNKWIITQNECHCHICGKYFNQKYDIMEHLQKQKAILVFMVLNRRFLYFQTTFDKYKPKLIYGFSHNQKPLKNSVVYPTLQKEQLLAQFRMILECPNGHDAPLQGSPSATYKITNTSATEVEQWRPVDSSQQTVDSRQQTCKKTRGGGDGSITPKCPSFCNSGRQQTVDSRQQTVDSRQQTVDSRQ